MSGKSVASSKKSVTSTIFSQPASKRQKKTSTQSASGSQRSKAKSQDAAANMTLVKVATRCEVCSATPKSNNGKTGALWFEYSKVVGDQECPVGPICQDCGQVWKDQYPMYKAVDEFIIYAKHPKSQQEITEIKQNKKQGTVPFIPQRVAGLTERGVRIGRPYVFFNAAEYKMQFKKIAPAGKRWPSVYMPSDIDGNEERLWYFRDTGFQIKGPHRKGELFQSKIIYVDEEVMSLDNHLYKGQAAKHIANQTRDHHWDTMKTVAVLTVEGELQRLRDKAKDGDDEDDEELAPPEVVADNRGEKDGDDEDDEDNDKPKAPGSAASSVTVTARAKTAKATTTPPTTAPSSVCSSKLTADVLQSLDTSRPGGSACSNGSQSVGNLEEDLLEDDDEGSMSDPDTLAQLVRKRIKGLNCVAGLDSVKLGNQERRFNELFVRLTEDDSSDNVTHVAVMRGHRELFDVCKASNIKVMTTLTDEQLHNNLQTIKEAKIKPSATYNAALFKRSLATRLRSLGNVGESPDSTLTQSQLVKVIEAVMPFSDVKAEFDILNPKLVDLDTSVFSKFQSFQQIVLIKLLVPLIANGATASTTLLKLIKPLVHKFEDLNTEEELSNACMHVVMNCLTIWRSLMASGDDDLDIVQDLETFNKAVCTMLEMAAQTSSRDVKATIGQVIRNNEYWSARFKQFVDCQAKLKDMLPQMQASTDALKQLELGVGTSTDFFQKATDVLVAAQASIRPCDYNKFSALLMETVLKHAAAVQSIDPARSDKVALLKQTNKLLHTVETAFPDGSELLKVANDMQEKISQADLEFKNFTLIAAIALVQTGGNDEDPAALHQIAVDIESCLSLTPTDAEGRLDAFKKLLCLINGNFNEECNYDLEWARLAAEQLSPLVESKSAAESALALYKEVAHLFRYMVTHNARSAAEAWAFSSVSQPKDVFDQFLGGIARAEKHMADLATAGWDKLGEVTAFENKLKVCQQVAVCGKLNYIAAARTKLNNAVEELKKIAGGRDNGTDWQDAVPADADFAAFMEAANTTLLADAKVAAKIKPLRGEAWQEPTVIRPLKGP